MLELINRLWLAIGLLTPEEQAQKEFDEAEDNAMIEEDLKWASGDDGIETEEDL